MRSVVEQKQWETHLQSITTIPSCKTLPAAANSALAFLSEQFRSDGAREGGNEGTYTLTVTNIVKAAYTFDRAHSVLKASITA
jgi:hypothetical protein